MLRKKLSLSLLSAYFLFNSFNSWAGVKAEEELYIFDPNKIHLQRLIDEGFVIDHVHQDGYEVYGPKGFSTQLEKLSIPFSRPVVNFQNYIDYPSPEKVEADLRRVANDCPQIVKLEVIGKSVKNRPLIVLKFSDNPQIDEIEPEFKYISSMHGDEIVGRELMVKLVQDLCSAYGQDSRITEVINQSEIFIMASMNPDGSANRSRANANGYDLNRDFPDFTSDPSNSTSGRQAETVAIMNWQSQRQIALSANFHGGAEVVNYMWDTEEELHPLDSFLQDLSLEYSKLANYIFQSREFPQGIVRGYYWYEVDGGMQDWSYYRYNDLHFTVELSAQKWPPYSKVAQYYKNNKEALIRFMELVHQGSGFYFSDRDVSGNVSIRALSSASAVKTDSYNFYGSEFYKVLPEGSYEFTVETDDGRRFKFQSEVRDQIKDNGNYVLLH